MQIVFPRGFGPYRPGRVYDLPGPIADLHIRGGRAKRADDPPAEKKPAEGEAQALAPAGEEEAPAKKARKR